MTCIAHTPEPDCHKAYVLNYGCCCYVRAALQHHTVCDIIELTQLCADNMVAEMVCGTVDHNVGCSGDLLKRLPSAQELHSGAA